MSPNPSGQASGFSSSLRFGETAPQSIVNERSEPHHSPPLRQPRQDRPTSHHGRSSLEPQRTLPPIRDLQARGNEFRGYPPGYDTRQDADPRYPASQPPHTVPAAAATTTMPRAGEQARPYPASGPSSPYASPPSRPYATEPEYMPRQFVTTTNSQNGTMSGDAGDSRNRRRRGNLPKAVTDVLRQWIAEHLDNPYPSDEDKQLLIAHTGLTSSQVRSPSFSSSKLYFLVNGDPRLTENNTAQQLAYKRQKANSPCSTASPSCWRWKQCARRVCLERSRGDIQSRVRYIARPPLTDYIFTVS